MINVCAILHCFPLLENQNTWRKNVRKIIIIIDNRSISKISDTYNDGKLGSTFKNPNKMAHPLQAYDWYLEDFKFMLHKDVRCKMQDYIIIFYRCLKQNIKERFIF